MSERSDALEGPGWSFLIRGYFSAVDTNNYLISDRFRAIVKTLQWVLCGNLDLNTLYTL